MRAVLVMVLSVEVLCVDVSNRNRTALNRTEKRENEKDEMTASHNSLAIATCARFIALSHTYPAPFTGATRIALPLPVACRLSIIAPHSSVAALASADDASPGLALAPHHGATAR